MKEAHGKVPRESLGRVERHAQEHVHGLARDSDGPRNDHGPVGPILGRVFGFAVGGKTRLSKPPSDRPGRPECQARPDRGRPPASSPRCARRERAAAGRPTRGAAKSSEGSGFYRCGYEPVRFVAATQSVLPPRRPRGSREFDSTARRRDLRPSHQARVAAASRAHCAVRPTLRAVLPYCLSSISKIHLTTTQRHGSCTVGELGGRPDAPPAQHRLCPPGRLPSARAGPESRQAAPVAPAGCLGGQRALPPTPPCRIHVFDLL